ncbi:MAG: VCBS repeat-containing protein [Planctomycetes bacterium]|nr:VCBS repeat-containing protein [Planctomycetota bacterium]
MNLPRLSLVLASSVLAGACARHSGNLAQLVIGDAPRFETRIEIPTGSSTHSDYFVADFNGDTKLDMAVVSLTGEMHVLIGNGTTFTVGQQLSLGGIPMWMAGGDLDDDGDQDLVVVRSEADATDLYRNDGNGSFTLAGTLSVGANALAVVVDDLDGDGTPDIVVSRPSAPEIMVGYSDGNFGFHNVQTLAMPGGGSAFTLRTGDITRDQVTDLMVADPQFDRVLIYQGAAETDLDNDPIELSVSGTPAAIAFGDVDGNGEGDMVVSCFSSNQLVCITDVLEGKGWYYNSFAVDLPARPSVATVGDVTGDGMNDVVVALAFTASIAVVPALAGGYSSPLGEPFVLDATGLPLRPFIGDFDQNGVADVCVLSGLGSLLNLWLAKDNGSLIGARSHHSGLPGAAWIEGADFDGDGKADLATGSYESNELAFLSQSPSGMAVQATFDVGDPIHQLAARDLDLDGKPDLVVGIPGGIRLLHNLSTPGNFSFEVLPGSPVKIGSGEFPFGLVIADLDRDGNFDIALCDYVGGGVHLVRGTNTPFEFADEVVLQVGGGPVGLAAADFTGDGQLDLAVSRAGQSDLRILANRGSFTFEAGLTVPVGESPNYLVTGDFDRDGRADLVVSNAISGSVTVLFGNGAGFDGQSYAAGAAPTALLAKDLNGDGFEDILVASLQSGDFRVLVGDGKGGFPLLPSFPGTLGASDAVLQDMDGDGVDDLMISSLITNRVSLVRGVQQ